MKRIVLLTGHYFESKRKAGFHWLAEAYWQAGWEVVFVTLAISWLSYVRKDYRLQYPVFQKRNRVEQVRDRLHSYVWFTPWHPANLRLAPLNRMANDLYGTYGELPLGPVESYLKDADVFVFESNPSLLLFERFKRLNPTARYIYRVSDDMKLIRTHPRVIEEEGWRAEQFDLISTPSEYIYRQFSHHPQARLHPHGLAKELFDTPLETPYRTAGPNLIFVGNAQFDFDFLDRASDAFPEWNFHIIGPIKGLPSKPNVHAYGERPFKEIIPYLQHGDIGLQILAYSPGAESFTDSLKMSQYTYCKLPIVAPDFLRSSRPHAFYYRPGDTASIREALTAARTYDRSAIDVSQIRSWSELANELIHHE